VNRATRFGIATLAGGVMLGLIEILVARHGVASHPVLGYALLLTGVLLGVAPLRIGLPIAIVLGCNQGFILYFIGGSGRYWKEAFVATLVVRALRANRLGQLDIVAGCGVAALGIAYGLRGSTGSEIAWGLKLLVLFAIFGWALYRLPRPADTWIAAYAGLAIVVAGAVPFALWQRMEGVDGLMGLGYPYGVTLRVANGSLRAFAGFTYGAPFAYSLVVAALFWTALSLGRERRLALATAWIPCLAAVGIFASLNRIALVGGTAAVMLGVVRHRDVRLAFLGLAAIALVVVAVSLTGLGKTTDFLGQGFTFSSNSAQARTTIWSSRWQGVSAIGSGPSSAGAAFDRVHSAAQSASVSSEPGAGVVDNLYLSWLVQYGIIFGGVLVLGWLAFLLAPLAASPQADATKIAAELVGVFAVVAGMGVNAWEEFPLNLLIATSLALRVMSIQGVAAASSPPPPDRRTHRIPGVSAA
jgi:hypothetical protein